MIMKPTLRQIEEREKQKKEKRQIDTLIKYDRAKICPKCGELMRYAFGEVLHKLCKNRNKLLNYLIYAYYTDKEFCNADKSILWNVFGKDICSRYLNGNVILNEKKLERLKKSEEKAQEKAEKVKEMCQSANIVHIHGLEDGEIIITKNELLEIDNNIDDSVARRLMIVLLGHQPNLFLPLS